MPRRVLPFHSLPPWLLRRLVPSVLLWLLVASDAACRPGPAAPPVPTASAVPGNAPTRTANPTATAATTAPAPTALSTAASPIRMAFSPSTDTAKVLLHGGQVARLLEGQTRLKFQISVPISYAALVEALNANQVDVAWLTAASYVYARNRYGVDLLLTTTRNGSKTYPFALQARAGSPITSVLDLKGKDFAFVDRLSTSGNLYPRAYMLKNGLDPDRDLRVTYLGSHDNVVIAVYNGQVDAGATYGEFKGVPDAREAVKKLLPDVMEKVRPFYTSDAIIPNDTVSARKGLPADLKKKVQEGLTAIAKTEEGLKELKALYNIDGLVVGDPKDYDPIEAAARSANIDLGESFVPSLPAATAIPALRTPTANAP